MNKRRSAPVYGAEKERDPVASLAQAQSIPLATDGLADASVPASVPKWNLVLPQNPVSSLGNNSLTTMDFNVQCQDIGKIQNMLINFNYTTASGKTPIIVPTPYFVDHIDFLGPDGNTLETITNDMLWVETCSLLTDQAVNTVAPLFNFAVNNNATVALGATRLNGLAGSTGFTLTTTPSSTIAGAMTATGLTGSGSISNYTNTVAFAPATTPSTTYNHWLSLNNSFLAACQPYLKGCGSGFFKIRLYLASCLSSDGDPTTQGVLTANWTNLWIQEAVLSENAERALMAAHRSGIQYSSVVRNRLSLSLGSAIAATSSQTLQLQGFFAESAGLYFMFKPSTNNADCLTRLTVDTMYLQDSQGRQLTQSMSANLIEAIVAPSVVPVSSYFINAASQTTYLFPFCTNLTRVIEGKSLGSYQLTGNERLNVLTGASPIPSGTQFVAISWDYAKLVVVNHSPRQYVLGSNS